MVAAKAVNILGIRGVPAAHGGFETFAHHLAPYLVGRGWDVTVYCQHEEGEKDIPPDGFEDDWQGVRRVHLRVNGKGPASTIKFDYRSVSDVLKRPGVDLVLGYNTALFCLRQRLAGRKIAINMDGVEWRRDKWSLPAKIWFYLNEFAGSHLANIAVADHPEIARHLRRHGCRNAEVIPYGSARVTAPSADHARLSGVANIEVAETASAAPLAALGLEPGQYLVSIARIEPENSILEIVRAFSAKKRRTKLAVLGNFRPDNAYHQSVKAAASPDVAFLGAIYDKTIVEALRVHALAYMHGHQVGGTNPSLVEALGTGSAVIAHDNRFNRWVAGEGQFYFRNEAELAAIVDQADAGTLPVEAARLKAVERHAQAFTFAAIHEHYEAVLERLRHL